TGLWMNKKPQIQVTGRSQQKYVLYCRPQELTEVIHILFSILLLAGTFNIFLEMSVNHFPTHLVPYPGINNYQQTCNDNGT
ncbi:TPA: hypothetical protein ACIVK9_005039, partial [Salmonella enterica subsp. enterica serovar Muenchen]